MHLSKHDLFQIDEDYVISLEANPELLSDLTIRAIKDLKLMHERADQNSSNSSIPPSSQAPWDIAVAPQNDNSSDDESDPFSNNTEEPSEIFDKDGASKGDEESKAEDTSTGEEGPDKKGKLDKPKNPGKQPGAQGFGRTQKIPITSEVIHRAEKCSGCGVTLPKSAPFKADNGFYTIDIKYGDAAAPGIVVINTKHLHGETSCSCGHKTKTEPYRVDENPRWNVQISEWKLIGPNLLALICCLNQRCRMSRSKVREFLATWFQLQLSIGVIHNCTQEAARAVEPIQEELIAELVKADLLHIDETSWKESGKGRWLWVFVSKLTILFLIGCRGADTLSTVLKEAFNGWLMSDGYGAYRKHPNRLRCWPHLIRKAKGISESLEPGPRGFGETVLNIFELLIDRVYEARAGPCKSIYDENIEKLEILKKWCDHFEDSEHEKTRALAREILNDWEAIFRVLDHPELPLSNNEAERALRHWVIARRISYGTRTPQGSRAFALIATVTETCRRRGGKPWKYIAEAVDAARRGETLPSLPAAA